MKPKDRLHTWLGDDGTPLWIEAGDPGWIHGDGKLCQVYPSVTEEMARLAAIAGGEANRASYQVDDLRHVFASLADLVEADDILASLAGQRSLLGMRARFKARRSLALAELGAGDPASPRSAIARTVLGALGLEVPEELQAPAREVEP